MFPHRHFGSWDILAEGIFGGMDILAWDITATKHFSTWIFWNLAKQYGHFLLRHFGSWATAMKYPSVEMSHC